MPRLLERDDVMRTAVNLGRAEKVWSERLVTGSGDMTFKLPESGMYQVVFVRVENKPTIVAKRPFSARRKYLTEELMHLARKLRADGNVLLAGFAIAAHSTTNSPMPPERLKAVLRPYQDEDLGILQAWYDFKNKALEELAEERLHDYDIEFKAGKIVCTNPKNIAVFDCKGLSQDDQDVI